MHRPKHDGYLKSLWLGLWIGVLALLPGQAFAQRNSSNVVVIGDLNRVTIEQTQARDSGSDVRIIGVDNVARVNQSGATNYAVINSTGLNNSQGFAQAGDGINWADVTAVGANNSANVTQFASVGGANDITATQFGTGNVAITNQIAALGYGHNGIQLAQTGDGNRAVVSQNGADLNLVLNQNNGANNASISQSGANLGLALTQTGGQSISIAQTGPGG